MARPFRKGFFYFPLDVDFFRDVKIKRLRRKYHSDGITIYLYLLCEIYGKEEYYLPVSQDTYGDISDELGIKETKVNLVVNFLLKESLFDSKLFLEDKLLTSRAVQLRFQEMVKERARNRIVEIPKKHWLLSESETAAYIKLTHFEDFPTNNEGLSVNNGGYSVNNDTKEKESKVNKSKEESRSSAPLSSPPTRHKYGAYKNVLLTDQEYKTLQSEFPNDFPERIERVSEYMASSGKTYKNYLATIRSWARKDNADKNKAKSTAKVGTKSKFNNYTDTNKPDYSNMSERILADMLAEAEGKGI